MNRAVAGTLATVSVLAGPLLAHADALTYDFTGSVTSTQGIYSSIAAGTTISGTYTIDYAAAIGSQSTGTAGSTLGWDSVAQGGAAISLPAVTGVVFSSTAQVGSYSYSSLPASTWFTQTYIQGGGSISAYEQSETDDGAQTHYSYFDLSNALGQPFTSAGLPVLTGPGDGYFETVVSSGPSAGSNGTVYYDLDSLTPVPLPSPAWLLLSGMGLTACLRRRSGGTLQQRRL